MKLFSDATKEAILARIRAEAQTLGKTVEAAATDVVAELHTSARNALIEVGVCAFIVGLIVGIIMGLVAK